MSHPDVVAAIRQGVIGEGRAVPTSEGLKPLVYADYVASGRALRQIEEIMLDEVLPFYANTHSESSYVGAFMTRLREEAREIIATALQVPKSHAVLFCGSGATEGLNRIVRLLDIERVARNGRAVVLIGPYEHHSNILPWRESGAKVVEIPEAFKGGPDPAALEAALRAHADADLIVGSFSAASNVTGTLTDTERVTRTLKRHGALAIWDYACAGPYVQITLGDSDAIVISTHKFVGGPGASGLLICDRSLGRRPVPSRPGGGTVTFVSPWAHRYSDSFTDREEGGTPNILGDIRAGLTIALRDLVDDTWLAERQEALRQRALTCWSNISGLDVLGHEPEKRALPIFSLVFRDGAGEALDPGEVALLLSERYGLQVRGGCSCAGPYGHRLLGIDRAMSERLVARLDSGLAISRLGWVRLNLSPYLDEAKADWIIATIAEFAHEFAGASGRHKAPFGGRAQRTVPQLSRIEAGSKGHRPESQK